MVTENIKKQLADFKKQGKSLAYLINYISGMIAVSYTHLTLPTILRV